MNIPSFYGLLLQNISPALSVRRIVHGRCWTGAELSDGSAGIAFHDALATVPRRFPTLEGLPASEAAKAILSWNLEEAGEGMAVINAWYNNKKRLPRSAIAYDYLQPCTAGLRTAGRSVGLIGHLSLSEETFPAAKSIRIMERAPRPGDYPDSACEEILPACDLVLITGSALINKTMPRLLALSEHARVILIGPTVPLCPALHQAGISRLCGMAAEDPHMLSSIASESVSGYRYGGAWMLDG